MIPKENSPSDEDDAPLVPTTPLRPVKRQRLDSDASDDKPLGAPLLAPPKKKRGVASRRVLEVKEESFEPISCWWEREKLHDGVQWSYLEHNGLLFTSPYEPHGVPVVFGSDHVVLLPEAEEVANYWCQAIESEYSSKSKFIHNFWNAFVSRLPANHSLQTAKFEDLDFSLIKAHLDKAREELREKRKNMTKSEREADKAFREKQDGPFMYALFDWLKEKVGSYKSEPPSLFRGRGEHPKMGQLKRRIFPDEVTLNCDANAPVPRVPLVGHSWKDVFHDNTVSWLAYYRDTVNGNFKYVFLGAGSAIKGQKDHGKYEKARKLKGYIDAIRADYNDKVRSTDMVDRQLGTACYMLDVLALRVGNEKDSAEEADTVGCCSLRLEHITFNEANSSIALDFLGKDSIRYLNTVVVSPIILESLKVFCRHKAPEDTIFDQISPASLNKYLKDLMPGLSAKVFRTYNASVTLQQELDKLDVHLVDLANVEAVKQFYDSANRAVAILCNHQRSIPKQHQTSMEKMQAVKSQLAEDMEELKAYSIWLKGNRKKSFQFKASTASVDETVTARMSVVKEGMSEESVQKKMMALAKRKENHELKMQMKDDNKTVSTSTSKQHYMDPRITVAFCKKWEVPIEKLFNTGLRKKFPWAMYANCNYAF